MFNWLKNLFKKKQTEAPKAEPSKQNIPEIPDSSKKKLKIAVVLGHGSDDPGASGQGTNEVEYNTWCMKQLEGIENVKCFYGKNSIDAIRKSLPYLADLTIQLHLNSAGPTAHGCEVLVLDGDKKSYPYAEKFADMFCGYFRRRMRGEAGKKKLTSKDRGYSSLKLTMFGAKILAEPWFLSNKEEYLSKEEYAQFLKKYIEEVQK